LSKKSMFMPTKKTKNRKKGKRSLALSIHG
jgi:hypothetical protein